MKTQARSSYGSLFGLSVLVLVAVVAGCTPDVKDIRTEGIQQFRGHQYIESMATLRSALNAAPNDAQSNYYMGLNYRALAARKFHEDDAVAAYRDLDTAVIYFTQAVKSWPNYMEAVASRNEALEARGKYAQALALAEHVTRTNRGDATEHFVYLGDEYRDRGDYDNALRAYKIALAEDRNCARAYASMGKLFQRSGDLVHARDSYCRAYELNPKEKGVADEIARLEAEPDIRTASHQPHE